jgi:hypothetical protein
MNKIESKVNSSLNVKTLRSGRRLKADENTNSLKIAEIPASKEGQVINEQEVSNHLPLRDSANLPSSSTNFAR